MQESSAVRIESRDGPEAVPIDQVDRRPQRNSCSMTLPHRKEFALVHLWMFLQGVPGVKEVVESELGGFSAFRAVADLMSIEAARAEAVEDVDCKPRLCERSSVSREGRYRLRVQASAGTQQDHDGEFSTSWWKGQFTAYCCRV